MGRISTTGVVMNDKFDRIVREPLVMGGQARIRDTNITVNEIVRLSLDGMSQADILAKFPKLDAEDVHQAFTYGISITIDAIARYRSNVLEAITPIIAWSEIISGKIPLDIHRLDKNSKDIIPNIILINAYRAKVRNYALGTWAYSQFKRSHNEEPEPYLLHELVQEAIKEAKEHKDNSIIQHTTPDTHISVATKSYPSRALTYLLIGSYDLTDDAILETQVSSSAVTFVITRNLVNYVNEFKFEFSKYDYGSLLHIADLIIYQNGSILKVQQEGSKVIFEFELPIWEGDQD
jgi:uncharacterized protein (DUF433 family)